MKTEDIPGVQLTAQSKHVDIVMSSLRKRLFCYVETVLDHDMAATINGQIRASTSCAWNDIRTIVAGEEPPIREADPELGPPVNVGIVMSSLRKRLLYYVDAALDQPQAVTVGNQIRAQIAGASIDIWAIIDGEYQPPMGTKSNGSGQRPAL